MRPFQIILIATFLLLGLVGIAFFALYSGVSKDENPYGAQVVIWGTLDDEPLITALAMLRENDKNASVISYVQKDARTFETELVNALAESRGPDLIILPHDLLISYRAKIAPLSFDTYPVRTFKDSYIDGAEIFMLKDGIYALPIAVDPLLMYWNKDIFSTKGLATPPATWEEMVNVTVPRIVERDFSYNVTRAALAFGQYVNVRNAKNILSLLFMQAGSVMAVDSEEMLFVELDRSATMQGLPPAQAGLTFFTQFSNPVSQTYTWNRALPEDRNEFLAGDLALYFGLASEVNEIRNGNPNLNFDAAEVPQGKGVAKRQGYGIFYGMARIKNSENPVGATNALYALVSQAQSEKYADDFGFGNVYRASHQSVPSDPFLAVVERASLIVRGWLDPSPAKSDNAFKQMVDDVVSGRLDVSNAVKDAEGRMMQ